MFPPKEAKKRTDSTLQISHYLDPCLILFLETDERDPALWQLVEHLDHSKKLIDKSAFYRAILEREKLVSTGIGMGIAVPHAKLPGYKEFFIAIGIHPRGIEWDALDHIPVRLIFMIGGPDDRQTEYLQLLSRLTLAIKDEDRRKKMLQMSSPEDIIAIFRGL